MFEDEHARLLDIEAFNAIEDPWFVARLDLDAVIRRSQRLRLVCWIVFALGVVLMLGGSAGMHGVVSAGTVTAGIGAALILWSAVVGNDLPVRQR